MNINTPKISIIVPIYNVEAYLDRCMQSLIMQTLREIEIIMVDDESPDNCPTICDNYAKQDSRIKVIHKKNGGLGFARNSGLEIATGKYIAFLDSDDFVDISMYETLYNTATQYNLDTVFCGFNQYSSYNIKSKQEVSTFTIYEGKYIKEKVLLNIILLSKKKIEPYLCRFGMPYIQTNLYKKIIFASVQKEKSYQRISFLILIT